MIYYFLYELLYLHFREKDWYLVKALNVFQYVTFRTAYATITALLISLFFGSTLIDALKKWNVGQQIREEGPKEHMVKRGTPTMGGVLIVGAVLISTLLWAKLSSVYVWTAMIATLLFAAIGFVDDYSKMAKKRSLGLTARQKLLAQLLVAVLVWAVLFTSTRFLGGTGY
jgi:phospho-N-acetylmuramoyl-pentapeptide-transferase